MVEDIWKEKGMLDGINKKVAQAFAKKLWSGVVEGYTRDIIGIDYNSPDLKMLSNLQTNVYAFSAAKNWQQMKALTQALISEDGQLRTYSQFKNAAFEINDQHVNHWLKAEYDTAIASGQMASKWVEIQASKKKLGMLEFDAVMDQRTSDLCRGFNGIVLPVDHPFWKQYYPPNHFRCRSTVRQRSGGKETDLSTLAIPEKLPEMFKVNLGERGLAFPPEHPYWLDMPKAVLNEAIKVQSKEIREWAKSSLVGRTIKVNVVGEIGFSNTSVKEILNQPHTHKVEKNQLLYSIDSVLKKAKYVTSAPDAKGNTMVKAWHYLEIRVKNEKSYAVIKETATGEKFLYSIVDHLK